MSARVVIHRKKVSHLTRKNFQMDFLDPNDGHYEYSAFATNKKEGLKTLWNFTAGRGAHEKTLSELKQHLAFDTILTTDWDANSTWQLISALTHNVARQFQITMGAMERVNGRKRTYRWVLESLRTLRYELINLPAKLSRPGGGSSCVSRPHPRRRTESQNYPLACLTPNSARKHFKWSSMTSFREWRGSPDSMSSSRFPSGSKKRERSVDFQILIGIPERRE
jgi:hypothetical protein